LSGIGVRYLFALASGAREGLMSRFFISHAGKDYREARALRQWLIQQEPPLVNEIFLDVERRGGIQIGEEWVNQLRRAGHRAEAVICLLSPSWERSAECRAEFRLANYLSRPILCARLEPYNQRSVTADWQHCDLFGDGAKEVIDIGDGQPPLVFAVEGLRRLKDGIRGSGIAALSFPWPPKGKEDRLPYRGREPYDECDAGVFFGRDVAIINSLLEFESMRGQGGGFFVLRGPSGAGLTSFLRAGLLPRVRIEDRHFVVLDVVRCDHEVLTGQYGLPQAIFALRQKLNLGGMDLGDIKEVCQHQHDKVAGILAECQRAAGDTLPAEDRDDQLPSVVLPLDNTESLFLSDAGLEELAFRQLIGRMTAPGPDSLPGVIVALTVRAHNYGSLRKPGAPLAAHDPVVVDLTPIQANRFESIIEGPAERARESDNPFTIEPMLMQRLLDDYSENSATLPLLSLALFELVTNYAADLRITLEEYDGGDCRIDRLLQREIHAAIAADPSQRGAELEALHEAFIPWLVTVDDQGSPTGKRAQWADLPPRSQAAVNRFVERRLLVKDVDDQGNTVVGLAIERILGDWRDLAGWVSAELPNLKSLRTLEHGYRDWEGSGRDAGHLLSRAKLKQTEPLERSALYGQRLAPMQGFLSASRGARIRSLRKYLAVVSVLTAVAVVCAIIAVVKTFDANHQRDVARAHYREVLSTKLVAEAGDMLAGSRSDGDERAIQQILASRTLTDQRDDNALYAAATQLASTSKIIDAPEFLHGIAISRDGKYVASASFMNPSANVMSGRVRIWEADSGKSVGEPVRLHKDHAWSVAFSPDGRFLVSGSSDRTLQRWDTATGQPVGPLIEGHTDQVYTVAYNNDGSRIVSAGQDGTIIQSNAQTGERIGDPIPAQSDVVWSVAYSPDGHRIVSGGSDGTVRQWSADSGEQLVPPMRGHDGNVWSVAYSPDGLRIVSGGQDATIRQWQTTGGAQILPALTGHQKTVGSVAYVGDAHRIVSGSADGTVRLWNADTARSIGPPLQGQTNAVMGVAVDTSGDRIVSGSTDNTVRIWRPNMIGLGGPVQSVTFSRDLFLVAAAADGMVTIRYARTGQPLGHPLQGNTEGVSSLAFSDDGTRVVSGGADKVVRVWDTGIGDRAATSMNGHDGAVLSVAFNGQGDRIVSGGADGTVREWSLATGREVVPTIRIPNGVAVRAVAFSPDGLVIASGSDDTVVRLWKADSGELLRELKGNQGEVTSVAFNRDGTRLVSGGFDTSEHLFDTASGQQLQFLTGHRETVTSVRLDPSSEHILSGSEDQTVRLWKSSTGKLIGRPIDGFTDRILKVAFSPDGKTFMAAGADGTVGTWPTSASENDLCAKLTVNVSHARWQDWVAQDVEWHELCKGLPEVARN
jgi:WD40 repeat protein